MGALRVFEGNENPVGCPMESVTASPHYSISKNRDSLFLNREIVDTSKFESKDSENTGKQAVSSRNSKNTRFGISQIRFPFPSARRSAIRRWTGKPLKTSVLDKPLRVAAMQARGFRVFRVTAADDATAGREQ
jgi:hypothetical protein